MNEIKDVDTILSGSIKQDLLQQFRDTFTKGTLYKKFKEGENYVNHKALPNGDNLINNGYFITKGTLETLKNAIVSPDGGVWINLAVGETFGRGDEIQLVLTATETIDELASEDLGKLCVTTAQIGAQVDPPYTGITSPKN